MSMPFDNFLQCCLVLY